VRTKFAQALIVCALVFAIGAHWTLLQSIAWLGMAVSYSHNSTLKEALVKTFDGKHPCTLCKVVQQGKSAQQKQDAQKQIAKLDLILDARPATIFCLVPKAFQAHGIAFPIFRNDSPPIPPPRTLSA